MPDSERQKRPIDRIRESAGSIDLNIAGDESEITGTISFGDRLLIVKGRAIYEIIMADQIDPERTNPKIPNTFQQVVPFGSDDEFIGRTLLTSNVLIGKGHLDPSIDPGQALTLVLDLTKHLGQMKSTLDLSVSGEKELIDQYFARVDGGCAIAIPSFQNIEVQVRLYVQKANHVLQYLFDLAKLFYKGLGSGGWENLKQQVELENRPDNFPLFIAGALKFLALVRNMRNAIEHERPEMKLIVRDFALNPSSQLVPPSMYLLHPKTPLTEIRVTDFMSSVFSKLVDTVEAMLGFLCVRRVVDKGRFPIFIIEVPEKLRADKNIRYGYGVNLNGQILPLS